MKIQTPSLNIDYLHNRFARFAIAVLATLALTAGLQLASAAPAFAQEENTTTTSETTEGANGDVSGSTTNEVEDDVIKSGVCGGANLSLENTTCENEEADKRVNDTLKTVLNLLSVAAGIASVVMMIYAGFRYIISGGDEKGVVSAKKTMIYAIVGVALVVLAQTFVQFILNKLV